MKAEGRFFCCAKKCGFQYGQTEYGKGPHFHIQTIPGVNTGGRGELPENTCACQD